MLFKRRLGECAVAGALLVMAGGASASGFALIEQSASGMGNAFAGGAAVAEDASTIFFNPAGMSRLSGSQLSVAAHAIRPSAKFTNSTSVIATASNPLLIGNGGDAGSWALVPNAYFAMEVNPQMRIGLGINAPFGLQTQYDANWLGRFQAVKSKLQTINLNPAVSYDVSDAVSLGLGLNYQQIDGELSSAVNYGAAAGSAALSPFVPGALKPGLAALAGARTEGVSIVKGKDSAWGYNFGALIKLSPQSRLGLAYRSKIKYNLTGTVSFSPVPAPLSLLALPQLQSGAVTLPITMPDSFSISGFHQVNEKWDVMADLTWTGWSVLQQLKIDRSNGTGNVQTVQENWKNTWRIAVGANHHYNEQWTARMGVAFDQAPVSDAFRTARIPDNNRTWLSLGGQYKPSKKSALDFGYAHLFVKNASISDIQNNAAIAKASGNLIGTYNNSVDILSAQYTYSF